MPFGYNPTNGRWVPQEVSYKREYMALKPRCRQPASEELCQLML